MNSVGYVIQVRMGSTRLPGKALKDVCGKPFIVRLVERLKKGGLSPIVIATTEKPEDDILIDIAKKLDVFYFRGDENDVLKRYIDCSKHFGFKVVVRITGDNIFTDPELSKRLSELLLKNELDYAVYDALPPGITSEAVSLPALERIYNMTDDPRHREHVTLYIKEHRDLFKALFLKCENYPIPYVRLTTDTYDDLKRIVLIYRLWGREDEPSPEDIGRIIKNNENLFVSNG